MLDRIRRRAGAGISLRGLFVAGDRLRPAFRLCATLPWREIGKAERQTGQRGAVIGLGWGFVAALLVSLAGCAVGPDFAPPLARWPTAGLEWRNKSLQTGPEEYRDWWRVFHDPILDLLIDIAYSQNLTLLSAGTKVLQGARSAWHSNRRVLAPETRGAGHGKL